MKPYSERIPAAIAKGKRLLAAAEYVLIPPHIGGNDTKLTLVLTAGEVALAKALAFIQYGDSDYFGSDGEEALIAFCEKIEKVSHD